MFEHIINRPITWIFVFGLLITYKIDKGFEWLYTKFTEIENRFNALYERLEELEDKIKDEINS